MSTPTPPICEPHATPAPADTDGSQGSPGSHNEPGSATVHHTGCPLCEACCGLVVTTDGDRVLSIKGDPDDPLSRGHLCPKAIALQDLHTDPDRLRTPVRRVGPVDDATWEPMTWPEAIEEVAARLVAVQRDHGQDALAVYLGNPNVHSLGALLHGVNLVRLLGTRNTYSATSVDQLPHQLVAHLLYGHQFLIPIPDIDRTSLLVLVGNNPMASNGSIMTVPEFPGRLRELRSRGGRLVVLDPRRTETAAVADAHHFVRPGSDAFVLLAILRELLVERGVRPQVSYVDDLDAVATLVEPFTVELAADRSGLAADEIRGLATELAQSPGAAVHGRVGASTQEFGTLCQWAIQVINLVTGNLDRPGGTMLTSPAVDVVGLGLLGKGHLGRWHSRVRGLPEFAGELPVAALAEELTTPGEGQIRGLLTVAGNPVSSTPAGHRLADALAELDVMVAIDFYVNESTRHADIILPPTGPLERDHYDLIFDVLAVRNTARFNPAVFAPPPHARHDWQIASALAEAIVAARASASTTASDTGDGAGEPATAPPTRDERILAMIQATPRQLLDQALARHEPALSVEQLLAHPSGIDLGPLRPQLPERLLTPDQRIHLLPSVIRDALVDLAGRVHADVATAPAAAPDPGASDLLLIGRRHQRDNNSWLHNSTRLTKGRARHQLYLHPDDAAARGIANGAAAQVSSAVGTVTVEARVTDEVMPGVVSLPHGYGHGRPGVRLAEAIELPGVSMNDLTDPGRVEQVSGNAILSGVPVTVSAATPQVLDR